MKKLESQNKILIGVLVAVILINLLLRLFWYFIHYYGSIINK